MLGDLDTGEGPCGTTFGLDHQITCKPAAGWRCRACTERQSDSTADLRCWLLADRFQAVSLEVLG
jgi:hypothetical protein